MKFLKKYIVNESSFQMPSKVQKDASLTSKDIGDITFDARKKVIIDYVNNLIFNEWTPSDAVQRYELFDRDVAPRILTYNPGTPSMRAFFNVERSAGKDVVTIPFVLFPLQRKTTQSISSRNFYFSDKFLDFMRMIEFLDAELNKEFQDIKLRCQEILPFDIAEFHILDNYPHACYHEFNSLMQEQNNLPIDQNAAQDIVFEHFIKVPFPLYNNLLDLEFAKKLENGGTLKIHITDGISLGAFKNFINKYIPDVSDKLYQLYMAETKLFKSLGINSIEAKSPCKLKFQGIKYRNDTNELGKNLRRSDIDSLSEICGIKDPYIAINCTDYEFKGKMPWYQLLTDDNITQDMMYTLKNEEYDYVLIYPATKRAFGIKEDFYGEIKFIAKRSLNDIEKDAHLKSIIRSHIDEAFKLPEKHKKPSSDTITITQDEIRKIVKPAIDKSIKNFVNDYLLNVKFPLESDSGCDFRFLCCVYETGERSFLPSIEIKESYGKDVVIIKMHAIGSVNDNYNRRDMTMLRFGNRFLEIENTLENLECALKKKFDKPIKVKCDLIKLYDNNEYWLDSESIARVRFDTANFYTAKSAIDDARHVGFPCIPYEYILKNRSHPYHKAPVCITIDLADGLDLNTFETIIAKRFIKVNKYNTFALKFNEETKDIILHDIHDSGRYPIKFAEINFTLYDPKFTDLSWTHNICTKNAYVIWSFSKISMVATYDNYEKYFVEATNNELSLDLCKWLCAHDRWRVDNGKNPIRYIMWYPNMHKVVYEDDCGEEIECTGKKL
jgi:hypothetical protein